MARYPRLALANVIYHVLNRGNNHQVIFIDNEDYQYFIERLKEAKEKYRCKLYSYVLMPNHIHFLIEPLIAQDMAKFMKMIAQKYGQYINKKYKRTGTLWDGRYKSSLVSNDDYFITCCKYIEMNPVRAGIVSNPEEYQWSSYNIKIGMKNNYLIDLDIWYETLGKNNKEREEKYKKLFDEIMIESKLKEIRESIVKNKIYGNDEFKREVGRKFGYKIETKKRGRPKSEPVPNFL